MQKKIFLLDNYDSFTYNIYHALTRPGFGVDVYRPHQTSLTAIEKINPHAIVFSPGPKNPADYPLMGEVLERFGGEIPILGICLGMQAINAWYGGKTVRAEEPVHGKVSAIDILGGKLFRGMGSEITVARYHSLIVDEVPAVFNITARRGSIVMAIEHKRYAIYGVQFHPESFLTPMGKVVFDNFLAGI